jgi:hypothetical protein
MNVKPADGWKMDTTGGHGQGASHEASWSAGQCGQQRRWAVAGLPLALGFTHRDPIPEEKMTRKSLGVLALAVLVGAGACGVRSQTVEMNPASTRAATCLNAVEVYEGRTDVPADYYELAWIEAEGSGVWTSDAQLREVMRRRAAEAGANGLIANTVQQNKVGVNVLGDAVGARTATARVSGLAIWMPAHAERVRLACGPAR